MIDWGQVGVRQPYEIQTADQQTLKSFKVVKTR